ncbi:glucosamine-6-phosphate deaminase [Alkaliphilus peptidifermentans]|uniref:Glucosamine-6-phosphate deaminase n=1 Tax=Alkaliphilus peptidifermentans DSM 18978 TaxID=1120976 RepID=A0A1G5IRF6_9FIRM|nr:glucosamine-6-phosphate deaminase [Alkaliphilus peptidifermentans]SCY78666.1 glucosamine-6-phosphate deaminase [Alkaliphilus peptidifermentans DSM 18978]
MRIIRVKHYQEMSKEAAQIIAAQVTLKPNSVLGLATGSTPIGIYNNLIKYYKNDNLDFSSVKTVNLDEYCGLGIIDEQSYHYYMKENLFDYINVDVKKAHIPNGLAKCYESECKRYDHIVEGLGGIDLQLLGIGHNGHIGFNEPGSEFYKNTHLVELHAMTVKANSRFFESEAQTPKFAITLGMKAIMTAKTILLVVGDTSKINILEAALFGPITPEVPASLLQIHPNLIVVYVEE